MKKTDQITILDGLITKVDQLVYSHDGRHRAVKDDALSFVRNTLDGINKVEWEKRINLNLWYPIVLPTEEHGYRSAWELGKKDLINILKSIRHEIELYTPDIQESVPIIKTPIVFLSHCSSDKQYADALEKFIIGLGVKDNQLIYSSHPLHKIPLDVNIYDYLRKNIYKEIFMIILWSNKYLESPACLNEMGAAWVTQSDYTNIFTPSFSFENPKFRECAVDTRKMGGVLNGDAHCKANMLELKDKIQSLFGLENDEKKTAFLMDAFIKEITA